MDLEKLYGKEIPGYPGYRIDPTGTVWSIHERMSFPGHEYPLGWHQLKWYISTQEDTWGYAYVSLVYEPNKSRRLRVADLLVKVWGKTKLKYDERDFRKAHKWKIQSWWKRVRKAQITNEIVSIEFRPPLPYEWSLMVVEDFADP